MPFFDIQFDIVAREIVLTKPLFSGTEDFATTTDPSVQNGGILLYDRVVNYTSPMFGIGMEEVIGNNMAKVAYEMNRWQAQAKLDGASIARWTATEDLVNNVPDSNIQTYVSYD